MSFLSETISAFEANGLRQVRLAYDLHVDCCQETPTCIQHKVPCGFVAHAHSIGYRDCRMQNENVADPIDGVAGHQANVAKMD